MPVSATPIASNLSQQLHLNSAQMGVDLAENSSFVVFYDSLSRIPSSGYLAGFSALSLVLFPVIIGAEFALTALLWRDYCALNEAQQEEQQSTVQVMTAKSALVVASSAIGMIAPFLFGATLSALLVTFVTPILFIAASLFLSLHEARSVYHSYQELKKIDQSEPEYVVHRNQMAAHAAKCVLFVGFMLVSGFALIAGSSVAATLGVLVSVGLLGFGVYDGSKRYQMLKKEQSKIASSDPVGSGYVSDNSCAFVSSQSSASEVVSKRNEADEIDSNKSASHEKTPLQSNGV